MCLLTNTQTHIYKQTHKHTHINTHIQTHTDTNTYKHTKTHTHTNTQYNEEGGTLKAGGDTKCACCWQTHLSRILMSPPSLLRMVALILFMEMEMASISRCLELDTNFRLLLWTHFIIHDWKIMEKIYKDDEEAAAYYGYEVLSFSVNCWREYFCAHF